MRIVIVPSWYNSPKAPSRGNFITAQARGLSLRGHNVSVIVLDRDSDGRLLSVRESMEDGMRHFRIVAPSPFHRLIGFYAPSLLAGTLCRIITSVDAQVVHAHAVRPAGILVDKALRSTSVPWCLTEHSSPLRAFWKTQHGWRQIASAYANAPRLFAVSRSLRDEMQRYFGDAAANTRILSNGIDTDVFKPLADSPGRSRLLFVGGLEPKKGVDFLLAALAELPPHCPWRLSVVGSGALASPLRALALRLKIADRVDWLGVKRHIDMPEVYAAHDFLVVPSTHETFSLVCAEALACARPVIATRCGGPEEVVPPFGGKLVPCGDAGALVQALREALSGRLQFDAGRAVAYVRKNYSMTSLLDQLEQTYRDVSRRGN